MTLMERYLDSVRMFLPHGSPHEDILAELRDQLQSTIEEREVTLGRHLTEPEIERVLSEYGSPMIVAGRYGGGTRSLAFGGVLIGPELFPLYLRILLLNWAIALAIHGGLAFVLEKPAGLGPFMSTFVAQFVGITATFSIIDRLQRRSRQRWYFPRAYLQPVPRWQSAAGLAVWGAMLSWWVAIPYVPSLLLGRAAGAVELAPGWYGLYWPIFVVLAASAAQRAVNLVRPDWNWLWPAARLTANLFALAMLYLMLSSYPYLIHADPAATAERMQQVRGLNDLLWWALAGIAPFYWVTHVAINGWFCAQHIGYTLRRRQGEAPQGA